jgi:hypothetical protein
MLLAIAAIVLLATICAVVDAMPKMTASNSETAHIGF